MARRESASLPPCPNGKVRRAGTFRPFCLRLLAGLAAMRRYRETVRTVARFAFESKPTNSSKSPGSTTYRFARFHNAK